MSLSDLKGKKVFLNFWATWCNPCKTEMPETEKLYQKTKDSDQSVASKYNIASIPTSYFIDAEGNIISKNVGGMNIDTMKAYIDLLKK